MAQTKIPPGGDFFDKQHAGMHKAFGFGGSVSVPQGHPMGVQPQRVENRFDGSTVIHHKHGGKTVNHLGGMVTHHKKTGTLIPTPRAVAPPPPPGPMGPAMNDGDADDMGAMAPGAGAPGGMKTGGRVKRAEGGSVDDGDVRTASGMSIRPLSRYRSYDGDPAPDDDDIRTGRIDVQPMRRIEVTDRIVRGNAAGQRDKDDRLKSGGENYVGNENKYARGGRVKKASGGDADESYSTSRSALARLKDGDSEPSRSAEVYERTKKATGGRVRVPKGMKAKAMMPRSPINTPPRNPKITRTPDDAMPGGDLPYGVQPSTEKGYRPLNRTTDAPRDALGAGMKKGGKVRRRGFDDGGAVDSDSNRVDMSRLMGRGDAPSGAMSNVAADFKADPAPAARAPTVKVVSAPGAPVRYEQPAGSAWDVNAPALSSIMRGIKENRAADMNYDAANPMARGGKVKRRK